MLSKPFIDRIPTLSPTIGTTLMFVLTIIAAGTLTPVLTTSETSLPMIFDVSALQFLAGSFALACTAIATAFLVESLLN